MLKRTDHLFYREKMIQYIIFTSVLGLEEICLCDENQI